MHVHVQQGLSAVKGTDCISDLTAVPFLLGVAEAYRLIMFLRHKV